MVPRTVEDRLREEYFDLLPDIRRVTERLEAEIRYAVLPVSRKLEPFERLAVKSRIKECESALEALRRRQEGATFDRDRAEAYTLTELKDLAGVRILAFPRGRLAEIDHVLRERFPSWAADPIVNDQETLAFKYCGYCEVRDQIRAEYQIVSMLIGLFWEVEHSAIYKPTPRFRGVTRSLGMQQRSQEVLNALTAFEREFEALVRNVPPGKHTGKLDDS